MAHLAASRNLTRLQPKHLPISTQICSIKRHTKAFPAPDPEIDPKRKVTTSRINFFEGKMVENPGKGKVHSAFPMKITLEKRRKPYFWCTCGLSKQQPFCDSSHRRDEKPFKPLKFVVEETKEYWLCNCKQTDNAPFCDGSHKSDLVTSSVKK